MYGLLLAFIEDGIVVSCAVASADAALFGNVESLTVLGRVRALHFQIGGEAGKSQPEISYIICLLVILYCAVVILSS
jgi:hypothetical protein